MGFNCSIVSADLHKIFEEYWFLGNNDSQVPKTWPQKYDTNFNYEMPILVPDKSDGSYVRAVISVIHRYNVVV